MTASEDQQLHPQSRPTEIIAIAISTDTLDSLKQIAIDRDMSIDALLKLYIGQGLRQDLAKQSANTASELNLSLLPEEVQKTLVEAAQQTGETREAIALQWLIDAAKSWLDDPLEQFIGAFDGGGSDWADRHDEYLGGSISDQPSIVSLQHLRPTADQVVMPTQMVEVNIVRSEIESNG